MCHEYRRIKRLKRNVSRPSLADSSSSILSAGLSVGFESYRLNMCSSVHIPPQQADRKEAMPQTSGSRFSR